MTVRPLADVLDEAGATAPIVDGDAVLRELRAALDDAARDAVDGLDADLLPLRVPKDRLAKLLACERHLLAIRDEGTLGEAVIRGRVLDRLLHHHVHGDGAARGSALALAEGAFEAERDDDVLAWLEEHVDDRRRVAEEATAFADRLAAWGPIDPAWWPRCEDRVRVDLADGRVVCAAQLDLVVGGAPTGRPMVIVEVKSGGFGPEHRDGLFWYALLSGLRHGVAPAAAIAWSAWDGAGWCQPVTPDVLRAAADRATTALRRLGELARGRPPRATPCRACAWCPERDDCDVAAPDPEGDADRG